jgi:alpha-mannosidase
VHEEDDITDARIRRVVNQHIRPALSGPTSALEVAAYHVHGEPVTISEALNAPYELFPVGGAWGPAWDTTWFQLRGQVPAQWRSEEVALRFEIGNAGDTGFGAEALVWDDGRPVQGLSPNHRDHVLTRSAEGGEAIELYIEAAANPRPPLGALTWPLLAPEPHGAPLFTLARAELRVVRRDLLAFWQDLRLLLQLLAQVSDEPRRSQIRAGLDRACTALDLTDVAGSFAGAHPLLKELLARPAAASAHRVSAVGHAHIDTAWLWPLRETVRKCARTFSTAVGLMDEYPDYRFACSQAQQYAWMKDRYPDLYRRMKEKVARGQLEPVGSMWVEADCNIPSGESLVRQILHGKRFFAQELGRDTTEVWLPDVFGYPGSLPQIMRQAGIDRFLTQKLSWNQYNVLPHHSFVWEGIDGSRVFTHFPPADTYNGNASVAELVHAVRNFKDHDRATRSLYVYGHGDGGGGPTAGMIESLRRLADLEGAPRVELEPASSFFDKAVADIDDPAVWVGELYLELHRGTYTTQAATKKGNRAGELALREAELWASLAPRPWSAYPAERLDRAWKTLLLHQFHDIIPGSGIHWVYEDTARDHAQVASEARAVIDDATTELAAVIDTADLSSPVVVLNPLSHDRAEIVSLSRHDRDEALVAIGPDGERSPVQVAEDGALLFSASVPSCGHSVYDLVPGTGDPPPGSDRLAVDERGLENDRVRVRWDDDGLLTSVWDRAGDREVLAPGARGNVLQVFEDYPNFYDAWDVDRFTLEHPIEVTTLDEVVVTERGPHRASVRMTRSFGDSRVTQTISLSATSGRLDFVTSVDWQESRRLLKVAFPVDVRSQRATYEIQYGHVERPTHANTSWDLARFEVCAQRWADLSEPGYGVALLNDCKYGYDIQGNVMRLSLLRAPGWPDPQADRGPHRFTYALLPHSGDLQQGGVVEAGYELNVPLRPVPTAPSAGEGGRRASFLRVDRPGVVIDAVKKAEDTDALVVRLYEAWGQRGPVRLTCARPVRQAQRADLLERAKDVVETDADGSIGLRLRPFEIVTLLLSLA